MAIKEQDVVLVSKDESGNKVINMPVTRVENVEGAVKTINKVAPGADGNVNLTSVASATKATQDGNGKVIADTYATKAEVNAKAPTANPTFTGTVTGTFKGNLTGNASTATSATKATQDAGGNVIASTYATKTEVTSGLAGKAPTSHTHTVANVTGLQAALDGKQAKGDYATTSAVNAKININGARGLIAGYESIGNHTTITDTSPDSNETANAVTVNNGQANVCWTKIVHLTAASPSVTLGGNWKWQNGTNPELKQNGFLVLCWCNTMGLAVYNNVQ